MDDAKWIALDKVAARCGCTYGGKPSWRRLLTLIARCVLAVSMRDKVRMHEIRKRRVSTMAELDAHAELTGCDRKKSAVPPASRRRTQSKNWNQQMGCRRDTFGFLIEPK